MNIRQLEYIREIAACGSFSKAAERLYVAQPAVSMAVRQLEDELGLELINRTAKPVKLTPEGERVMVHIDRIMEQLVYMKNEIDDLKDATTGRVHIGIPEMLGNYYFTGIVTAFKAEHPEIDMTIDSEPSVSIKQNIAAGRMDLGIISIDSIDSVFEYTELFTEEILVCVSEDNPLAAKRSVRPGDIADCRHVAFGRGNYHQRELLFGILRKNGIEPVTVYESNLVDTIVSLVRKDIGISAFLKRVIADKEGIVSLPLDPPIHTRIGMAWKKDAYLSRANRLFIEYVKKYRAGV